MINDVAMMQNAVSNRLLDLFQQSFTLVVLLALLLSTHFQLALISLVAGAGAALSRSSASARGCGAPATAARSAWPTSRA